MRRPGDAVQDAPGGRAPCWSLSDAPARVLGRASIRARPGPAVVRARGLHRGGAPGRGRASGRRLRSGPSPRHASPGCRVGLAGRRVPTPPVASWRPRADSEHSDQQRHRQATRAGGLRALAPGEACRLRRPPGPPAPEPLRWRAVDQCTSDEGDRAVPGCRRNPRMPAARTASVRRLMSPAPASRASTDLVRSTAARKWEGAGEKGAAHDARHSSPLPELRATEWSRSSITESSPTRCTM